jgi:hypothetical protein
MNAVLRAWGEFVGVYKELIVAWRDVGEAIGYEPGADPRAARWKAADTEMARAARTLTAERQYRQRGLDLPWPREYWF